jgi:hypothetical protein
MSSLRLFPRGIAGHVNVAKLALFICSVEDHGLEYEWIIRVLQKAVVNADEDCRDMILANFFLFDAATLIVVVKEGTPHQYILRRDQIIIFV